MTKRRFFFDDGKSRKRWNVESLGNTNFISYGRLAGKLRESKKTFGSTKQADEAMKKLVAKKQREGYVEILPHELEIRRIKGRRKATVSQVNQFQKRIGQTLPGDYRSFLANINGGYPNPGYLGVPGNASIASIGVGLLFGLQPSKLTYGELNYEWDRCQKLLPPGHLPIAGDSDLFSLSLLPSSFGSIYWWFHETDELDDEGNFLPAAGYLLASTFEEFLTRISKLYGTEDFVSALETGELDAQPKPRAKPKLRTLFAMLKHDHTSSKVREIKKTIREIGNLSHVKDGAWPFINLRDATLVHDLVMAGLPPEVTDKDGHSLLWQCAGDAQCISIMGNQNINLDRRSGNDGETALMRAIFLNCLPAVKKLIELGANPTLRNPRHIQRHLDSDNKMKQVVEKARRNWSKKRSSKPPAQKTTPYSRKLKRDSPEYKKAIRKLLRLLKHDWVQEGEIIDGASQLVDSLPNLNGIKDGDWPSIDKFENPELLGQLLRAGLSPNLVDQKGNTLLHQCVTHPECIKLIVKHGGDPNLRYGRREKNETALMRASYLADEDCIQTLVQLGADPTVEFTGMAKIFLDMDEEKQAVIDNAKALWNRKQKSKPRKKK